MITNTFKCFKTTVRVLVFLLLFQCSAIKGRGVFLWRFQTLLGYYWSLVFKQDKFTELLSHFVFSSRFGYCFAKMI